MPNVRFLLMRNATLLSVNMLWHSVVGWNVKYTKKDVELSNIYFFKNHILWKCGVLKFQVQRIRCRIVIGLKGAAWLTHIYSLGFKSMNDVQSNADYFVLFYY